MAPIISYTLSAILLVWMVVISGASAASITNSHSTLESVPGSGTESATESVTDCGTLSTPQTDGYKWSPGLGAAFKYRDENATWQEAANKCVEEGANLIVIDSWRKYHAVKSISSIRSPIHVGIHKNPSGDWVGLRTGKPLSTIPWMGLEPSGAQNRCAAMNNKLDIDGLWSSGCSYTRHFVCERDLCHVRNQ